MSNPTTDICVNPSEQSVLNRPNTDKFLLVLNMPSILRDRLFEGRKVSITPLQISVYGSVVPQVQVPAIPIPFSGQTYNITSKTRPNYPPLNVSFVVDNKFYNYWVLWKWLAVLNSPRTSMYDGKMRNSTTKEPHPEQSEYETTVSVYGLNEYNTPVIEFLYYNSFIVNLGGITYNYRENTVIESNFELQYSQFDVKLLG